jgi:phosphoribosylformylglycinamidine cyclo-ligase
MSCIRCRLLRGAGYKRRRRSFIEGNGREGDGNNRKDEVIRGEQIEVGDLALGMKSSGIHSNGLTLARKVVENSGLKYTDPFLIDPRKSISEELLTPTRTYTEVLELLKHYEVHNIYNPLAPNDIFTSLQEIGNVTDDEMYKTFNMGMGFAVVISESEEREAIRVTRGTIVGEVVVKDKGITVGDVRVV